MRTPVSSASRPWTICRKSGIVKKIPIRIRFWARSIETPPRSERDLQQVEVEQRFLAALLAPPLPGDEAGEEQRRRRRSRTASARSRRARSASCAARSQPQLLACRTPKTSRARPEAERTLPTQSSVGLPGSRSGSRISRVPSRMPIATTTSPTKTSRQVKSVVDPAAEDRADGDAGAGDAAEHAVGDRPVAAAGRCRRRGRPAPAGPARRRSPRGSTSRASARGRSRRRRSGPSRSP